MYNKGARPRAQDILSRSGLAPHSHLLKKQEIEDGSESSSTREDEVIERHAERATTTGRSARTADISPARVFFVRERTFTEVVEDVEEVVGGRGSRDGEGRRRRRRLEWSRSWNFRRPRDALFRFGRRGQYYVV